jgi:simple sugar transport system ATP-binding protein
LRGITKRFGAVLASDAVDLDLRRGEVHALLGENGAGKTTLMRILFGLTLADEGVIEVDGHLVRIGSPRDAIAAGIGMVSQHFTLVRPMTVAENLLLGRSRGLALDLEWARGAVRTSAQRLGMVVDPDARVEDLSIGQQQRVEILKALARDCTVLILDEPTAVLVPQESDALLAMLRQLAAGGMSIVFISHKLREVQAVSDRVTVLRRGRLVDTVSPTVGERELAAMMVGRPVFGVALADQETPMTRPPVARITGLSAEGRRGISALRDVSLEVRAGEIVGIAGVSGNGQTELVEVLSGMRAPSAGSVVVADTELAGADPATIMRAGVGRIPEDRHASLVLDLSVAVNLVLERLDEFVRGGRLDARSIERHARDLIARFDIRARAGDPVRTLSGGNIQKVLLARVLSRDPRLVVVSQPTRGLDVGATEYVRSVLLERRANGVGILLVSEDLDELLALSDRIIVLYEGTIAGELDRGEADPERLGMLMAGRGRVAA